MVHRYVARLLMCVLVVLMATASLTNALAHLPGSAETTAVTRADEHTHDDPIAHKSLPHHTLVDHEHMSFLPLAIAPDRSRQRTSARVTPGLIATSEPSDAPKRPPRS